MCGIMGYSSKRDITEENKRYVSIMAKNILLELSSRGKDATGYMAFLDGKTVFYKKPLPSEKFILRGFLDLNTFPISFIGHTRAATSGSPANNINNHPIIRKELGLVHNGVIRSWDTLGKFSDLRREMYSKTDSELIAVQIEKDKGLHNIPNVFDEDGSFAIAVMYKQKTKIDLMKDRFQPIVFADFSDTLQTIFFASTEYIIKLALDMTFHRFPKWWIITPESYNIYELDNSELKKAKDCTPKKKEKESDDFIGYPDSSNTRYLINRVEVKVRNMFKSVYGDRFYISHMIKFAQLYYDSGNSWISRREKESLKIAEKWIENQYNLYGELMYTEGKGKSALSEYHNKGWMEEYD